MRGETCSLHPQKNLEKEPRKKKRERGGKKVAIANQRRLTELARWESFARAVPTRAESAFGFLSKSTHSLASAPHNHKHTRSLMSAVSAFGSQAETSAAGNESVSGGAAGAVEATLDAAGRHVCQVEDSESDWSTDSDEEIITKDKVRQLQQPDNAPIKDVPKTMHEVLVPENVSISRAKCVLDFCSLPFDVCLFLLFHLCVEGCLL